MDATVRWGEKRYNSLDYYIKETFHEKLYKLSLNAGCTCPNRDGTCGTRGCIFCSRGGSGDFAADVSLSIPEQLRVERKKKSNTQDILILLIFRPTRIHTALEVLEKAFTQALADPEVKVLSIATRPDCLSAEILDLLERLSLTKPVWIELGLQTIHESTAEFIRRGLSSSGFLRR